MAFCTKCGNQLGEGGKFCGGCGASVGDNNPSPITPSTSQETKLGDNTKFCVELPNDTPAEVREKITALAPLADEYFSLFKKWSEMMTEFSATVAAGGAYGKLFRGMKYALTPSNFKANLEVVGPKQLWGLYWHGSRNREASDRRAEKTMSERSMYLTFFVLFYVCPVLVALCTFGIGLLFMIPLCAFIAARMVDPSYPEHWEIKLRSKRNEIKEAVKSLKPLVPKEQYKTYSTVITKIEAAFVQMRKVCMEHNNTFLGTQAEIDRKNIQMALGMVAAAFAVVGVVASVSVGAVDNAVPEYLYSDGKVRF